MKNIGLLVGKKTILRPPEEGDIQFLFTLRNNLRLQMLLMAQPRTNSLRRVKEWVAHISSGGDSVFFIVAARNKAGPLGYVQLTHMDFLHGTADLGICLAKEARGRGHGREVLRLLEHYARNIFNLRKIILRVFVANKSAIALYRKAGYRQVGVHSQHFYQSGVYHDVLIMEKFLVSSRIRQRRK